MKKFILSLLLIFAQITGPTGFTAERKAPHKEQQEEKAPLDIPKEMLDLANANDIKLEALPPIKENQNSNLSTISQIVAAVGITRPVFDKNQQQPFTVDYSGKFNNTHGNNLVIYDNIDAVDYGISIAKDWLDAKGAFQFAQGPAESRGMIFAVYGVEETEENPRISNLFAEAKQKGAHAAILITDSTNSVSEKEIKFGEGEKYTTDFSEEQFNNGQGKTLRRILSHGFKFRNSSTNPIKGALVKPNSYFVTMNAAQKGDFSDLQHHKERIFYQVKDPSKPLTMDNLKHVVVMQGSDNWTRVHFNHNTLIIDSDSGQKGINNFALEHALKMIQTFATEGSSGKISDINMGSRYRYFAKDGSFVETAYTDGENELNQRITLEFLRMAAYPEIYSEVEVVIGEFVFTNPNTMTALRLAWEAMNKVGRPFRIRGMLDAQFVSAHSYGLGAVMTGTDVVSPVGKVFRGFRGDILKKDPQTGKHLYLDIATNFETRDGAKDVDPDGAPNHRILTHVKNWITKMKVAKGFEARNGEYGLTPEQTAELVRIRKERTSFQEWTDITMMWDDSYNLSKAKRNAERQSFWFIIGEMANFIRAKANSILSYKDDLLKRQVGAELDRSVVIDGFAKLMGLLPADLIKEKGIEEIPKMINRVPIEESTIKNFEQTIRDIAKRVESRLETKYRVSQKELDSKLFSINQFFRWYSHLATFKQGQQPNISEKELVGLIFAVVGTPASAKSQLTSILWRAKLPRHILAARAYEAYEFMKLKDVFAHKDAEGNLKGGDFPFDKEMIFTPDMLDVEEVKQLDALVVKKDYREAGKKLRAFLSKRVEKEAHKEALADLDTISEKLEHFAAFAEWYTSLPLKPGAGEIKKEELLARVFTDNLDLLAAKEGQDAKMEATINYMLEVRGFQGDELSKAYNLAQNIFAGKVSKTEMKDEVKAAKEEAKAESKKSQANKLQCSLLFAKGA